MALCVCSVVGHDVVEVGQELGQVLFLEEGKSRTVVAYLTEWSGVSHRFWSGFE